MASSVFVTVLVLLGVTYGSAQIVDDMVTQSCTTSSVKGLSEQLVKEINCLQPNTLKEWKDVAPNLKASSSAVFPALQTAAVASLKSAAETKPDTTMYISSSLRTLPQQFLLYMWWRKGRCGIPLAASPGTSAHEKGLAIDMPSRFVPTWKTSLANNNFRWYGSADPVHFTYIGGGTVDLSSLSVRAFQRLWNRNNPKAKIDEDGAFGPVTQQKMRFSPCGGFRLGATCEEEPSYTYPVIKKGSSSKYVYTLQHLLNHHGHTVTVDGDFGSGTETKVKAFQTANGLGSDGEVGPMTWGKLIVVPVRLWSSHTHAVKAVQDTLNRVWGHVIGVDGVYGSGTERAVRSFQQQEGLDVSGEVGTMEWQAMVRTTAARSMRTTEEEGEEECQWPVLRLGDTSDLVAVVRHMMVEWRLLAADDDDTPANQIEGTLADSLRAFREYMGIPQPSPEEETPILVDSDAWELMIIGLEHGSFGPAVQAARALLGMPNADYFDDTMEERVAAYQKEKNLEATGRVDVNTWRILIAGCIKTTSYDTDETDLSFEDPGIELGFATEAVPLAAFECLVNRHHAAFAVLDVFRFQGVENPFLPANMKRCISAGITSFDINAAVNLRDDPTQQFDLICNFTMDYEIHFNTLWIQVDAPNMAAYDEDHPEQAQQANVEFLTALVALAEGEGFEVGIATAKNMWEDIMGKDESFKHLPLWISDATDAFTFSEFGGWTAADMHRYHGSVDLAGMSVRVSGDIPHEVDEEENDGGSSGNDSVNPWFLTVVIGGGLFIIGLVATVILRRLRRGDSMKLFPLLESEDRVEFVSSSASHHVSHPRTRTSSATPSI